MTQFIKGKQISNNSIKQNQLNVSYDSVINPTDITNKQYVEEFLNSKVDELNFALLNQNMVALSTSSSTLACEKYVIEYPISDVKVKLNGINVNVGGKESPYDCYFSSDSGTTVSNPTQKGDYLYWNNKDFQLDIDDELDFEYLVNYHYVMAESEQTYTFNEKFENLVIRYTGISGTTSTINILGNIYIFGNYNGQFIFDSGGTNEHVFTYIGETFEFLISSITYGIIWDGFGSLIFSVFKKKSIKLISKLLVSLFSENLISCWTVKILRHKNDIYILTSNYNEANRDKLYKTSDYGITWSKLNTPISYNNSQSIYDFIIFNNTMFLSMYYFKNESDNQFTKIFSSTDNGNTWKINYEIPSNYYSSYINEIKFYNNIGYASVRLNFSNDTAGGTFAMGNEYGILKSIDSGNTWNLINTKTCDGFGQEFFYLNENIAWFQTYKQSYINNQYIGYTNLYYSTDGGVSTYIINTSLDSNVKNLTFINQSTGFYNNMGQILKTDDSGYTWNVLNITEPYSQITGMKIKDNYIYVVAIDIEGYDSLLLISNDLGITWYSRKFTEKKCYVDFIDIDENDNILIKANYQSYYYMPLLYISSDKGETWKCILNENNEDKFNEYRSIYFIDELNGWIVGDNHTLINTINGGENWYKYNFNFTGTTNYTFTKIIFTTNNIGYIIGSKDAEPLLLKTTDNCISWEFLNLPISDLYIYDIYFKDQNNGYIVGYNSNNETVLLQTNNGGNSWEDKNITIPESYFLKIIFTDSLHGFTVGYNYNTGYGIIYKTIDGGENWIIDDNMYKEDVSYNTIVKTNNNILFITGNINSTGDNFMYKSIDNGNSWKLISLNLIFTSSWIPEISFDDNLNGNFILTSNNSSVIYTTSDAGENWTLIENSNIDGQFYSICKNYAVGYSTDKTTILMKIS